MTDRLLIDELKHDREGFSEKELAPFMQDAMDERIDRIIVGKTSGRHSLGAYCEHFAEEIAAKVISSEEGYDALRDFLETRIRAELADSDEVRELAAEFAQEKGE